MVITRNNPDYKEQKFKALYQWKMCVGKKARWRALLLACHKAGDKNLADQLPDICKIYCNVCPKVLYPINCVYEVLYLYTYVDIESLQRTPEKVMENDVKTEGNSHCS